MLNAAHFDAMADFAASRNISPAHVLHSPDMAQAHAEFMRWTGRVMPNGLVAYRSTVAAVLHAQNKRSVLARYPNADASYFPTYEPKRITVRITPQRALAAVACYEYQACETDDFKSTLAYAFCRMIEAEAISELREGEPWALEEKHVRPEGAPLPVPVFS